MSNRNASFEDELDGKFPAEDKPAREPRLSVVTEAEPITLSLNDLLTGTKLRTGYVDTPEWKPGSRVKVRAIKVREVAKIAEASTSTDAQGNRVVNHPKLCSMYCFYGMINEDGENLFTKQEHLAAFENLSNAPILRIFQAIAELSGTDDQDREDVEKNFESPVSGAM